MNISHIVEDLKRVEELSGNGQSVTIFGSSRFKENSFYYKKAIDLGKKLSDNKFNVITGGSSGIMEASNRGAKESGGSKSIGIHIDNLPNENEANIYLDKNMEFHYFFTRKVALINYSLAYIILPGGFGTLDEFFEVLNLIRTKNHKASPIILFGVDYWSKLYDFMATTMIEYGTINQKDLDLISISNDIDEVLEIIKNRNQLVL